VQVNVVRPYVKELMSEATRRIEDSKRMNSTDIDAKLSITDRLLGIMHAPSETKIPPTPDRRAGLVINTVLMSSKPVTPSSSTPATLKDIIRSMKGTPSITPTSVLSSLGVPDSHLPTPNSLRGGSYSSKPRVSLPPTAFSTGFSAPEAEETK
jgi:hypothetical protein